MSIENPKIVNYGHWNIDIVGEFDPEEWFGFIYLITNKSSGKMYIGKKNFKLKKTRKPLKGMKRKRIEYVDSGWKNYISSSKYLIEDIESIGHGMFEFHIIRLCTGKCELSYLEEKYQFESNVLQAKNSNGERLFYNQTIAHKNFAGIEKQTNESREKTSKSLTEYYKNNPRESMPDDTRQKISQRISQIREDDPDALHNIADWKKNNHTESIEACRKGGNTPPKTTKGIENLKESGRKSQKIHKENGTGFYGISPEDRIKNASKAGKQIKGKFWWYNTKTDETKRSTECPGDGWVRGRKP